MHNTSLWKHFAAFVYDIFPILGILIITSGITLILRSGNSVQPYTWWYMLIIYCEVAFYFIYFWKVGGQTIGMKAWKLKIIPDNEAQLNLTWSQATFRFLIGIFSTLLLGAGLFWKLFAKKNKTWMDTISNSSTQSIQD